MLPATFWSVSIWHWHAPNSCPEEIGQIWICARTGLDLNKDRWLGKFLWTRKYEMARLPVYRPAKEALEALSSALVSLCPAHMGWTKQRGSSSTLSKQAYQATRWNQTRCWSGTVTWDDLNRAWSWEMLFWTNWSRTTMQEGCSNFVADCTLSLLVLQSKCSILLDR